MRNSGMMIHLDSDETPVIEITNIIRISTNKEKFYNVISYDFKNDEQLIAFKNQMIQAVENYLKRRKNEAQ